MTRSRGIGLSMDDLSTWEREHLIIELGEAVEEIVKATEAMARKHEG